MGQKKKVLAFLLPALLLPVTVFAESSSLVLQKYGITSILDASSEKYKLDLMEEEFFETSRKVADNEMLTYANEAIAKYNEEKFELLDSEISSLYTSLTTITSTMYQKRHSPVQELFALDAQYKSTLSKIEKLQKEKDLLLEHFRSDEIIDNSFQSSKSKLRSMEREVEKQKDRYVEASTYPDLGQVNGLRYPLVGTPVLTSGFGGRVDPISGAGAFHKGIDLAVPIGTTVLAVFNGTVLESDFNSSTGNYIVIDHGVGLRSIYMHLNDRLVQKGQKVNQYQPIAKSGNTGSQTTGPHLHFGFYANGEAVDPAKLFK